MFNLFNSPPRKRNPRSTSAITKSDLVPEEEFMGKPDPMAIARRGVKNLSKAELAVLALYAGRWVYTKYHEFNARSRGRKMVCLAIPVDSKEYEWFCHWLTQERLSQSDAAGKSFTVHAMSRNPPRGRRRAFVIDDDDADGSEMTPEVAAEGYQWALIPDSSGNAKFRGIRIEIGNNDDNSGSSDVDWAKRLNKKVCLSFLPKDGDTVRELLTDICEAGMKAEMGEREEYHPGVFMRTPWSEWVRKANLATNRRPVLPEGTYDAMLEDAKRFSKARDWYNSVGVPYRRGYIMHGIQGSGKTTTAIALAADLKRDLFVINLQGMSDDNLQECFNRAKDNSILLIEDIDCAQASHDRATEGNSSSEGDDKRVTLHGLLNVIDGVVSPEGRILIATTNRFGVLDPALVRPGRFDERFEFTYADRDQIFKLSRRFGLSEEEAEETAQVWSKEKLGMSEVQERLIVKVGINPKDVSTND